MWGGPSGAGLEGKGRCWLERPVESTGSRDTSCPGGLRLPGKEWARPESWGGPARADGIKGPVCG